MNFNPSDPNNRIFALCAAAVWAAVCLIPPGAAAVTDETGRRVPVAAAPQRIVSLAPGITETLFALGLEGQIVGVTTFCDWPAAARAKTKIGGFTNPSIEKIVSLGPDLILATADGNRKETIRQLEKLGLPVYVINPTNTSGVLKSIRHIGSITGREREAGLLVETLQKKLDKVAARTRGRKKPRVFFQLGLEPMITAGRGTLIHEVIERAGGVNVAGRDRSNYPRYSAEGVISASPDIIVFAPMVNDKTFEAVYKFWRTYGEVPAVKNHKIYPIDADLINRASPRIFDAVERMALMFHPEMKP